MPNILLNKREELLPLLLLAIQHHPDAQIRDQLLKWDCHKRLVVHINFQLSVFMQCLKASGLNSVYYESIHFFYTRNIFWQIDSDSK